MSRLIRAFFRSLMKDEPTIQDPQNARIIDAVLELLEAIAEATDSKFDDWLVQRLRNAGVDEATIEQTMMPERSA